MFEKIHLILQVSEVDSLIEYSVCSSVSVTFRSVNSEGTVITCSTFLGQLLRSAWDQEPGVLGK